MSKNYQNPNIVKKLALLLTVSAMALTWLGSGTYSARAQTEDPDAIDPALPLALTVAINNHDPAAVQGPFTRGATVVFDNSLFGIPYTTMTPAEYASRQRPNQPDVPTDIQLEVVDGSVQIAATRASWTWRETAGFLKAINVDYIEFNVAATTQDHIFKSLNIAPTTESLAKLISLAPSPRAWQGYPTARHYPRYRSARTGE